jgi:CRISPR/Cas system-associated exonuclease Cas4 (RecB family)
VCSIILIIYTLRRLSIYIFATEHIDVINKVRGLMQNALKPNPIYTTRCKGCSLYPVCLPKEQEKINKIKINWDI